MNFINYLYLKSKKKFLSYKKQISERYIKNKQKIINLKLFDNTQKKPTKKIKTLNKKTNILKTSKLFFQKASKFKIELNFDLLKNILNNKNISANEKSSKGRTKNIKNKKLKIIKDLKKIFTNFEFETKKSLTITLLRARESLMMSFRPMLAKHNFTEQQWSVLRVLGEKGPCDAGQLATEACILSPSLSRIINTLIENNFITKKEDKLDKRKIILEISDDGKLKLESIKPEYLAILKSVQNFHL